MSQEINLYVLRLRPVRDYLTANCVASMFGAVIVALGLGGYFATNAANRQVMESSQLQSQLTQVQNEVTVKSKALSEKKLSAKLESEIATAKALLENRQEAMSYLNSGQLGNKEGFSGFLTALSRQTLDNLWLTGFTVSQGGTAVELRGRTLNAQRIPEYVQKLSNEPAFLGRSFAALDVKGVKPELDVPHETTAPESKNAKPVNAAIRVPFVEFSLRTEQNDSTKAKPQEAAK